MEILKNQTVRLFLFATYIFLVILFCLEELWTYNTNIDCSKEYRIFFVGFEFVESILGVFSIFGILFLIQEIRISKKEVEDAKIALEENRRAKKEKSPVLQKYWEEVQAQFEVWKLSQSEKQIATMMLRGFTNPQIAGVRGKSVKTIENQMFSIFQKSSTTGKLDFISFFISPLLPDEEEDHS